MFSTLKCQEDVKAVIFKDTQLMVPWWAKYLAQDISGEVWVYSDMPFKREVNWNELKGLKTMVGFSLNTPEVLGNLFRIEANNQLTELGDSNGTI